MYNQNGEQQDDYLQQPGELLFALTLSFPEGIPKFVMCSISALLIIISCR